MPRDESTASHVQFSFPALKPEYFFNAFSAMDCASLTGMLMDSSTTMVPSGSSVEVVPVSFTDGFFAKPMTPWSGIQINDQFLS